MSASEEFLRLVDLYGEYECACDALDDAIGEGVRISVTLDALDEAARAKEEYLAAVRAYSEEWGIGEDVVNSYVCDACDLRARYDRRLAWIESELRAKGARRDDE
jgi:hypothetical protein